MQRNLQMPTMKALLSGFPNPPPFLISVFPRSDSLPILGPRGLTWQQQGTEEAGGEAEDPPPTPAGSYRHIQGGRERSPKWKIKTPHCGFPSIADLCLGRRVPRRNELREGNFRGLWSLA